MVLKYISILKILIYLKNCPKCYINCCDLIFVLRIFKKSLKTKSSISCCHFQAKQFTMQRGSLRFILNKFTMILSILNLPNKAELLNIQDHIKNGQLIFLCLVYLFIVVN